MEEKRFEKPQAEIVELCNADIITNSEVAGFDEGDLP